MRLNKMKNILAIETTGRHASAAVLKYEDQIETEFLRSSLNDMNHLVDLMSLIDDVLSEAGIEIKDVDVVSPSIGPGSFTGIRIGVATARALSQALNTDCMPVRTLRGMVELDRDRQMKSSHYVCTAINARRGQTYAALWKIDENGKVEEILEQRQYMIDELLSEILEVCNNEKLPIVFCGDGSDSYRTQLEEKLSVTEILFEIAPDENRYQNAGAVARAAFSQIKAGKKLISYDKLLPYYMRKTEAEMRLEQGELSEKCKEIGR